MRTVLLDGNSVKISVDKCAQKVWNGAQKCKSYIFLKMLMFLFLLFFILSSLPFLISWHYLSWMYSWNFHCKYRVGNISWTFFDSESGKGSFVTKEQLLEVGFWWYGGRWRRVFTSG